MRYRIGGDGWSEELSATRDAAGRTWQIRDGAGEVHDLEVEVIESGSVFRIILGETTHQLTVLPGNAPGRPLRFLIDDDYVELTVKNEVDLLEELLGSDDDRSGVEEIHSIMPGVIRQVLVHEGAAVADDQPLLILEAMKMENEIRASSGGTVIHLAVKEGETVTAGELLARIERENTPSEVPGRDSR